MPLPLEYLYIRAAIALFLTGFMLVWLWAKITGKTFDDWDVYE